MTGGRILAALLWGFGIWAGGFATIYAVQGLGCALGWDEIVPWRLSPLRLVLLGLVTGNLAMALAVARRLAAMRRADGDGAPTAFVLSLAARCAWFAVAAVAITFSGVPTASLCA